MTAADRPRGFLASLEVQDRQRAAYLARHGLAPTPVPKEPWPVEHRPWCAVSIESDLARLAAGLAEDERLAQAAAPRWQDDFVDNPDAYGHLGGYVHDHAERFSPRRSSAQVEAIRRVIAEARDPKSYEPYDSYDIDYDSFREGIDAAVDLFTRILASIYPDPTEEA